MVRSDNDKIYPIKPKFCEEWRVPESQKKKKKKEIQFWYIINLFKTTIFIRNRKSKL
jgi:hypothetical protein